MKGTCGLLLAPACLMMLAALAPARAYAEETAVSVLERSGCFGARLPQRAELPLIVSAWAGKEATPFLKSLGYDEFDYPYTADEWRLLEERVHDGAPDVLAKLSADVDELGAALCPVLIAQAYADNYETRETQNQAQPYYQPYLVLAQGMLFLGGCGSAQYLGDFDASWHRVLASTAERAGVDIDIRDPASVARLLAAIERGACGTAPVANTAVMAHVLALSYTQANAERGNLDGFAAALGAASEAEMLRGIMSSLDDYERPIAIVHSLAGIARSDLFADLDDDALTDYGLAFYSGTELDGPDREGGLSLLLRARSSRALQFLESAAAAGLVEGVAAELYNVPVPEIGEDNALDHYRLYRMALSGQLPPVEAALKMARALEGSLPSDGSGGWQWGWLRLEVLVDGGSFSDLVLLADLMQRDGAVEEAIEAAASPRLKFALATILFEGHTDTGPDVARGLHLLEDAVAGGAGSEAELRLAVALDNGYGGTDKARAAELFTRASSRQLAAMLVVADRVDTAGYDGEIYRVATGMEWSSEIGRFFSARLADGSPFLNSSQGAEYLDQVAASSPEIARTLGETFLCADCGSAADVGRGVHYLEIAARAGDRDAALKLAGMRVIRPDLSIDPVAVGDEPPLFTALGGTGQNGDAEALLLAAAEQQCFSPPANTYYTPGCIETAHKLAIGSFGSRFASAGLKILNRLAAGVPFDEDANAALADVLAFYGNYAGALERLEGVRFGISLTEEPEWGYVGYTARNGPIRRAIVSGAARGTAANPALVGLLRRLSALGDMAADSFLDLLADPEFEGSVEAPVRGLETAQSDYDAQLARGGLSRGLASAARSLSVAHLREGSADTALKFELVALKTERTLNEIAALTDGALPTALVEVCELSKSSRRVHAMGFPAVARALAKDAVNKLQDVRREIAALPESLQACFADQVSDVYRELAGLFVDQNRPIEADYVMSLLKDFEAFQYVQRDTEHAGDAFDAMLLTRTEQQNLTTVARIEPPLVEQAARRNALLRANGERELTEAEEAELAQLDAAIAAASDRLDAVIGDLAHDADDARELESAFNSMPGRLLHDFRGDAISLRYIVLPDRMHVIIATPFVVTSHTWDELDGQPFTESALNALVAEFRSDLENVTLDPRPDGQRLFDLLLKPIWNEISGARQFLISADGQLRLIPFAALHDGEKYLVERVAITGLSGSQQPDRPGLRRSTRIAALGVSKQVPGFTPLPAVPWELAGLVSNDGDGYGLMEGRVALDEDFDVKALRSALASGEDGELVTVHIASHFALGQINDDSFLVMGGADNRLTITDLIKGIDRQTYNFGSVDLLTLSACQTAVPLSVSNGSELESLATIVQENAGRAVVATLWPIADKSTALFMQRFYELSLTSEVTRSDALAATMREFIQSRIGGDDPDQSIIGETARRGEILVGRDAGDTPATLPFFEHPYYWAAFLLLEGH
jgi:CHAT domain-containing protein/TPR repeat protein